MKFEVICGFAETCRADINSGHWVIPAMTHIIPKTSAKEESNQIITPISITLSSLQVMFK